jgi:bifunctional non-homologous end joining protein LigD
VLEDYNKKRDFTKSPEPAGDAIRKSPSGRTPRFFCVQKHLASHLHYDFRLEHNGVLLSWAVPKGPSLDPSTKRLAMHVEDHPIDYGDFEGVIPEGYGAGIVMLWDRGTWTPEVDDVDAALRKGDLKFQLNGVKLKGSWVLVRTRGWGGSRGGSGGGDSSRSWLLIKHRDEWSGDVDITTFAPRSVKSDGDFADILGEDMPAVWQSHRPAQSGDAGALFARIIAQAEKIKAENRAAAEPASTTSRARTAASRPSSSASRPPASKARSRTAPPAQSRTAPAATSRRAAAASRSTSRTASKGKSKSASATAPAKPRLKRR